MSERLITRKKIRALLFGVTLFAAACSNNDTEPSMPMRKPASQNVKVPTSRAKEPLLPSSAGLGEAMKGQTHAFLSIAALAGYTACNKLDITLEPHADGVYAVRVQPGNLTNEEWLAYSLQANAFIDGYEAESGDRGYSKWYPEYQKMHAMYLSNPTLYCNPS